MSLERKIESSIFLCIPRDLNILGKSCTTFVIVKIVRNLSRGHSPCQRVNHIKSGVIYFSAFIYSCIWYYSYVEPGPNNFMVFKSIGGRNCLMKSMKWLYFNCVDLH